MAGVIPLPVILVEFIAAFGFALLIGCTFVLLRLRSEGNWPPARTGEPGPSAAFIVGGMVVGFLVGTWAVASFIAKGFSF